MIEKSDRYGIVLVTTASEAEGERIAAALVEAHLAACVTITPVSSIYRWQGKVNFDDEWQLVIKTDLAQFEAIERKILELHSYEVPELVAIPIIAGSRSYLEWITQNV